MSKDEMRKVLSEHLAKFRTWSYAQFAERVERGPFWRAHDCLEHAEGTAPDATEYQMEFNVPFSRAAEAPVGKPRMNTKGHELEGLEAGLGRLSGVHRLVNRFPAGNKLECHRFHSCRLVFIRGATEFLRLSLETGFDFVPRNSPRPSPEVGRSAN